MKSKDKARIFSHAQQQAKEHSLFEKIPAFFRMIKAWRSGEYRPRVRNLVLATLAAVYVISPVDFIPEAIFSVFGLVDDFAIIVFVINRFSKELNRFLEWEQSRPAQHTIDTEAEIIK